MSGQKYSTFATIIGLFIGSLFYITAAGIECDTGTCTSKEGYAVAVGAISLFLSLVLLAWEATQGIPSKVNALASVFLFLWWVAGTGVGTFSAPFPLAGNGYFSAWFALFVSLYYVFISLELSINTVDLDKASVSVFFLFVSSVFYIAAAGQNCNTFNNCTSYNGYAVAVGVISTVFTMVLIGLKYTKEDLFIGAPGRAIAAFLTLWWVLGASIGTFKSPFIYLTNGYFAGWFCLFSSLFLLATLFPSIGNKINSVVHPESNAKKPDLESGVAVENQSENM